MGVSSSPITFKSVLFPHPEGPITEEGLRQNLRVGILYVEAWLRGVGCVPLYDLMEDAVIGLSWSFLDADDKDNDYDAFWSFNRQGQICCDGAFLADFKLMPIEDELFDKE